MTIAFFVHREFIGSAELEEELTRQLEKIIGENECEMLFCGYSMFDSFAYRCANDLRVRKNIRMIFVTPYITEGYLKNHVEIIKHRYDTVIYPELEEVPYKFAITARNKWMVSSSDLKIFFVNNPW